MTLTSSLTVRRTESLLNTQQVHTISFDKCNFIFYFSILFEESSMKIESTKCNLLLKFGIRTQISNFIFYELMSDYMAFPTINAQQGEQLPNNDD